MRDVGEREGGLRQPDGESRELLDPAFHQHGLAGGEAMRGDRPDADAVGLGEHPAGERQGGHLATDHEHAVVKPAGVADVLQGERGLAESRSAPQIDQLPRREAAPEEPV